MDVMDYSNKLIGSLIEAFRARLTSELFLKVEQTSLQLAAYAVPVGMLIGLGMGVVGAIKLDSFFIFVSGAIWVALVSVGYYIGNGFIERCRRVIENSPSTLGAKEFLDLFALLFIVGMIVTLLGGLYLAIEGSAFDPLKWAIPIAIVFLFYATLLLNPALISVEIREESSGGQDALAISLLIYKIAVRQAGVFFGIGSFFGTALLVYSLYDLFKEGGEYMLLGGLQSVTGVVVLLTALLFPLFIYLTFIFAYLIVDLCKAILTLNRRPPP